MASKDIPTVILYHYELSPYARKIRWFLQLLSIPYVSWPQPYIIPRPSLSAQGITYRRIPILSINGQTYCDSFLIVRALRESFPSSFSAILPPVSGQDVTLSALLTDHTDRLLFQPLSESMPRNKGSPLLDPSFRKDRRGFGRVLEKEDFPYLRENGLNELRRFLEMLEEGVLSDGRKWILGEKMNEVDISAGVFPAWAVGWKEWITGVKGVEVERFPLVKAWLGRVQEAVRAGKKNIVREIKTEEEGLELVREVKERYAEEIKASLGELDTNVPIPLSLGQVVDVVPFDSGRTHPQRGTIRAVKGDRFALETEKGSIVWFPWRGFEVRKVPDGDVSRL